MAKKVTIHKKGEGPIEITVSSDEIARQYENLPFTHAPDVDVVCVTDDRQEGPPCRPC